MQGGMGVNISTAEMAQAVAARGGIGHVSDAMVPDLADRLFGTGFTRMKALACKALERTTGEAGFHFPVEKIREAAKLYLGRVMEGRTGEGRIHVNIMEKLTMNASLETLRARLLGALDAGVDGISLSAGLHAGSFALMSGHPRFRDACLGVVVSSRRALNLFMSCLLYTSVAESGAGTRHPHAGRELDARSCARAHVRAEQGPL